MLLDVRVSPGCPGERESHARTCGFGGSSTLMNETTAAESRRSVLTISAYFIS